MLLHDQIRKNQALENRIRRLAYEQQRAQKLTDIATEKAGKLLDARDRHQKQIEERLKLQEQRREEIERVRAQNQLAKQISIEKKSQNYRSIALQNQVSFKFT